MSQFRRGTSAPLLLMGLVACGGGIHTESGSSGGILDAGAGDTRPPLGDVGGGGFDAAPDAGLGFPADTTWQPCGTVGQIPARTIAVSADGRRLALAYADGRLSVFDVPESTPAPYRRWTTVTGLVGAIAFSADGNLVAGLGDKSLTIGRANDGQVLHRTATACGEGSLRFSTGSDPLLLVSCSSSRGATTVEFRRASDASMVGSVVGTGRGAFADDVTAALFVDEDGTSITRTTLAGDVVGTTRLDVSVDEAAFSPSGDRLAGLTPTEIVLESASTGALLWRAPRMDPGEGARVLFSIATNQVHSVGSLRDVAYDLGTGELLGTTDLAAPLTVAVAVPVGSAGPPTLDHVMGITENGSFVDAYLTSPARSGPRSSEVLVLAASPDGRYLATGNFSGIRIFHLAENTFVGTRRGELSYKPEFSRDGTLCSLGGDALGVFRTSDGSAVAGFAPNPGIACGISSSVAISPDNSTFALGQDGLDLCRADGTVVGKGPSRAKAIGVAFSPDGRWIASTGAELWPSKGSGIFVPVWRASPPSETKPCSFGVVDSVAVFSPDSRLLLVSQATVNEGTSSAALFRVDDGSVVRDFGSSLARRPSFSPDASWIAAGSEVLHLSTDTRITLDPSISISTFLPDGRIAASSHDAVVRLFCPVRRLP